MIAEPFVHALSVSGACALIHLCFDDVTAHHQGQMFADEIAKVNQRRSSAGKTRQDKNLGSIILDVFLDMNQLLNTLQGLFVSLRLS